MEDVEIIQCVNKTQENLTKQLQSKVSYKIFFWFAGIVIAILSSMIGYLISINSNVTKITIENATKLSTIQEKVNNLEKQQDQIIKQLNK
ncbi:MAG TPA: hypothetical protein PLA71_01710 [Saccharofermentans sp.]|nr:hypothetical protein [Saccharofermentans sp.]